MGTYPYGGTSLLNCSGRVSASLLIITSPSISLFINGITSRMDPFSPPSLGLILLSGILIFHPSLPSMCNALRYLPL